MLSVKQLRRDLREWGSFWKSREYGKGYGSKALTENLGMSFNFAVERSDEIQVPLHLRDLDMRISKLRSECASALRVAYVIRKPPKLVVKQFGFESVRSYEFWLGRAEKALL